jgi:membrane protein
VAVRAISFLEAIVAFAAALLVLAAGATRSIVTPLFESFGAVAPFALSAWTRFGTLVMTFVAQVAVFRYIPSVRPRPSWSGVVAGALPTTLLLNAATDLLGLLVAHSALASLYGTAASLIMFLLWVYYSAWVALFGAETCHAWDRAEVTARP